MKRILFVLLFTGLLGSASSAQVLKLVATDSFYGAALGGLLWTGSAALGETGNFDGLGSSLGAGILVGTGMGVYDAYVHLHNGNPYRNGVLSQAGGTSMQIVTMDSFYGGLVGGMVGAAVALIDSKTGFLSSVGKGYGYGVWGGMVFGIVDAVVLATPSKNTAGLLQGNLNGLAVTGLSPEYRLNPVLTSGGMKLEPVPMVNLVTVSF